MRNVKRLLLVLIVLAVAAVTLLFVLENQQGIALTFLGWTAPSLPVAVLVMLAFLLGMLIGPVLGWYVALRSKRRIRKKFAAREPLTPVNPVAPQSPAEVPVKA